MWLAHLDGRVTVGRIPITRRSRQQWVHSMVEDCRHPRSMNCVPKFVTSANGHVISLYARDRQFRATLDQADAIDADGMPLVFASRWLTRLPLPERVATTDFFHDAAEAASKHGISFFLLGSTEEENRKAVSEVSRCYPDLQIAGRHHGYFREQDEDEIVKEILNAKTDVLWVGLGVPLEHIFIVRNVNKLRGVAWVKSCGGLINFLSGTSRRAPSWMQTYGLEWAHRVIQEPRRLFWRYFTTNAHAIYLILAYTSSVPQAIPLPDQRVDEWPPASAVGFNSPEDWEATRAPR
jgi:N-acetylglucosaminyldiphosphoundecaprenol N-acetyl-beta-D-mannosaminyltransferase